MNADTSCKRWQLTINNPNTPLLDSDGNPILDTNGNQVIFDHETIKAILEEYFKTFLYGCMADEMGSTYHTHLYTVFTSRVRFSMLKRYFPTAHIEKAKGITSENINYIKKEGEWEGTDKAETSIEGTFEEWGVRPADTRGKNHEMTELYELVKEGLSDAEIIAINQDYILNLDKISFLRTTLLKDEFKGRLRTEIKVIYISGKTGPGKTYGVLEEHGAENVFRATDYKHPFDHYQNQPVLVFDEFRSNLPLSDMLNYLDIYPLELPARYSNRFACYTTVYIISNWKLEDQYHDKQQDDQVSWKAFLRRIHEVRVFTEYKTYTTYNSVEEYMNRDTEFREVTEAEKQEIPFD